MAVTGADPAFLFQWQKTFYTEFISNQGPGASPVIAVANDASQATRILDVQWGAQIQANDDFVGFGIVKATGLPFPSPSGYIARQIPMPFPHYRDPAASQSQPYSKYAMYASKVNRIQGISFAGYSKDTSGLPLAFYKLARMELAYESLSYDILTDDDPSIVGDGGFPDEAQCARYVTRIPSPSQEYITLNQGVMYYAEPPNAPSVVPFGPGKILVSHDFRYRWELVPIEAVPSVGINTALKIGSPSQGGNAAIEYCLGRVNATRFPFNRTNPNTGYDPGTLLLTAAALIPIKGPNGRRLYTVEYFFKFLPFGHHKIFGPKSGTTGGFTEISTDKVVHAINTTTPDGVHLYDVADFSWLFRPPLQGPTSLDQAAPVFTAVPGTGPTSPGHI